MTTEEFEIQRETYFREMQRYLIAKHGTHRFVWSLEVYGKIQPYLDFLDIFVEIEWNEVDDKR